MCKIKFSFLIVFLINLSLINCNPTWKKPILDENKILENLDNYGRLIKKISTSMKKNSAENEVSKYKKFIHQSRTIKNSKLLVLAMDGFRFDYVDLYNAVTFKKLRSRGVYASEGLIPMFCTKTFPNFYSISTGVYQETHGIIDNFFKDLKLNKTFDVYSKETHQERFWFDNAEPIWLTAKKQGKTIGSLQWPATDPFEEYLTEFLPYDPTMNLSTRLDLSYEWLFKKDIDLVLTYYHNPDDIGHSYGPFSEQIKQEMSQIDDDLSKFIDKLDMTNNLDQFNLLIVSDHGMTMAKDLDFKIFLSDFIDFNDGSIEVINEGSVVQINAKPEQIDDLFTILRYSSQRFRIYRKEELPKRLHYGYLDRLQSLILIADEGYQIFKDRESRIYYIGSHGYDSELYSMRPIFYGIGPRFKQNFNTKAFETINLYNLMCRLLNIDPSPNNGTMQIIDNLLI